MPSFATRVTYPHNKDAAVAKLKGLMEGMRTRYKDVASDIEGNWVENVLTFSLKVMGFAIQGKVTVEDQLAHVEGKLPLAAALFRGRIEESIKTEMEKELA